MWYPTRHQWFRRMALGLAFASVIFAGRVSAAPQSDQHFIDNQDFQASTIRI